MITTTEVSGELEEKLLQLEPFIGNTPLVQIRSLHDNPRVKVFAKLEWQQTGGSIKARPAFSIIKSAVENGWLKQGTHLLDATSGNTGIAYAVIGARLGIPVTLCMSENASQERKTLLQALGVHMIYTPKLNDRDISQETASECYERDPERYYYADQYNNERNCLIHYSDTANEIYQQTDAQITHFVVGLGTSGTFVGAGRRLKELNENIELIALQPDSALHGLDGWKHMETAIVPGIFDDRMVERYVYIDTESAYQMIRNAVASEGLLLSPSSAANLVGAIRVANSIDEGVVVTVFPDNYDKYGDLYRQLF